MKKIVLLTLTCFALQSNAQLKTIKFSAGEPASQGEVAILNPFNHASSTEIKRVDYQAKTLNLQKFRAQKAGFTIIATDENGRPIAIEGEAKDARGNRNLSIEDRAALHIASIAPYMDLSRNSNEFSITAIQTDDNGNKHIRMAQKWNGIPVYGAELLLHTQDDVINFVNGRSIAKPENLSTAINIDEAEAQSIVKSDLGDVRDLSVITSSIMNVEQSKSEVVYYPKNGRIHLCHHFTFYRNLIDRWEYFIDVADGKIINKHVSICKLHHHFGTQCGHENGTASLSRAFAKEGKEENALMVDGPATAKASDLFNVTRDINTYQVGSGFYLIDGARPMFKTASKMPDDPIGAIWTIDAFNTSPEKQNFNYDHVKSSSNTWTSKTSISAHYNGGKAYDYYRNVHARNSVNGTGGNIVSIINVADEDGSSLGNAFWNGQAMFYGNGDNAFSPLAKALDVAGHEMTHGVVQNTANLEYEGESGALNESMADVFGSLIDRDDWLIGEDVVKPAAFPSGALRSLSDPHNGAATNDFNAGWQPRVYTERYTGSEDNGGVHINSGIPNYAYFLFASDAAVGKDKAEKVYYKALTSYLTKSSQFVDARVAIVRAAKELFGDAIASKATAAFDKVQIPGGSGGTYQDDVKTNPGDDLILFTNADNTDLFLYKSDGTEIANPLSQSDPISKPSITDDGTLIMFVASDKKIHYINIDWAGGTFKEDILNTGTSTWRNVAVSKDGKRLAALRSVFDDKMLVFDLKTGNGNEYTLTNPTFSEGISTGEVLYADAMEWDINGEEVMYDAENEIKSTSAGTINYWDISFIEVWNTKSNNFALEGKTSKLFSSLEEGESVGNPTFSKNSPYIIAFDYLNGEDFSILGANTETSDLGLIADRSANSEAAYPSYSNKDNLMIYDDDNVLSTDVSIIPLKNNKVEGIAGNIASFVSDARWGVWFSNGKRVLSALSDVSNAHETMTVVPNPASAEVNLRFTATRSADATYSIEDVTGKAIVTGTERITNGFNNIRIDVADFNRGIYIVRVKVSDQNTITTSKFVKL